MVLEQCRDRPHGLHGAGHDMFAPSSVLPIIRIIGRTRLIYPSFLPDNSPIGGDYRKVCTERFEFWSLAGLRIRGVYPHAARPDAPDLTSFIRTVPRKNPSALGFTKRHVSRIIQDLEAGGMVIVQRRGRGYRNAYALNPKARLRHPTLALVPLGRIIAAVAPELVENPEGATWEAIPAAD